MMKPVILYVISEDWYFLSHRLNLALAALREGYRVVLLTNVSSGLREITEQGIEVIDYHIGRGRVNLLKDLSTLRVMRSVFGKVSPDIVHCVGIKPVLYGGIAARWMRKRCVNALAGLGFTFSSPSVKARLLQPAVSLMLRYSLGGRSSRVIVQNQDDLELVQKKMGVEPGRTALIQGSGVDTEKYQYTGEPDGVPIIAFVARMLKDKGVVELIDACRLLRAKGLEFSLLLAGMPDLENPASLTEDQLREWNREPWIDWVGNVEQVDALWRKAALCVLPSYREGLPKTLLEAAASGRAIVTTDTPGCRSVVVDGENGLLVPVRNVARLADAIECLLLDRNLRQKMGRQGRERVLRYFDERIVVAQTLDLYRQLLA